jgi:hypothetical protein
MVSITWNTRFGDSEEEEGVMEDGGQLAMGRVATPLQHS